MPREWWHAPFGYIVKALVTLYKLEKDSKVPTQTEFMRAADIPDTTFYRTIKPALEKGGLVEFKVNPRERIIEVYLTDKGRKLAEALDKVYPEIFK